MRSVISLGFGGLEGSAHGVAFLGSVCGTYVDLLCGAMSFTVVMNAVLYVTANALDVSALAAIGFVH